MRAIRQKYSEGENSNEIDWYCDLGESGASSSRREYQRLREHVNEYDVVVAHELDRLGRSFADLAGFVEDLRETGRALAEEHDVEMTDEMGRTFSPRWTYLKTAESHDS